MINYLSSIKIFLTMLIILVFISGCVSGVKQSEPHNKQDYEKIETDTLAKDEITKQLKELHKVSEKEYLISGGDEFDIYVFDNPELLTKGVIVMPDGTISMGLAGVVEIEGKNIENATKSIEEKLGKYILDPKVTLIPNHIKSSTFTIMGSVVNPGVYQVKSGYNITDGIAVAQGFSEGERDGDTIDMANLDLAFILRDKKILPINFVNIVKKGSYLDNIPLSNGDYIYIPSVMNLNVFVLGQVAVPGYCAYNDNLTLLRAMSWAQGRLPSSSDIAIIVRGNLVTPTIYKVDVEDILRGRIPDFKLKPNDIIYFPSGTIADYNLIIQKIIPTFELLNLLAGPFSAY